MGWQVVVNNSKDMAVHAALLVLSQNRAAASGGPRVVVE
jgi:hypothetical protein